MIKSEIVTCMGAVYISQDMCRLCAKFVERVLGSRPDRLQVDVSRHPRQGSRKFTLSDGGDWVVGPGGVWRPIYNGARDWLNAVGIKPGDAFHLKLEDAT